MLISVKSYSEDVYLMRDVLLKHCVFALLLLRLLYLVRKIEALWQF